MLSRIKKFFLDGQMLVYTMGKVGSSSVEKLFPNALHTHTLYGTPPSPPYHLYKFGKTKILLRKITVYPIKRALIKLKKHVDIVTLYRDPVYRDPSMFFQDLPYWITYHQSKNTVNTRLENQNYLIDVFNETFLHAYSEWWVINELSRFTGIGYDELCLGNEDYKVVEKGKFRVFIGRSESLASFRHFLEESLAIPHDDTEPGVTNRGNEKWYSSAYSEFMKSYDKKAIAARNRKFRADNGYDQDISMI